MEKRSKKRTGEKIKAARIQKGFTQKHLAQLCNMYESQIRKYESGSVNPKIETLQKIATALEIPVSELRSDFDADFEIFRQQISSAMKELEKEVLFLNYLLSLGYKYIDDFHDNEDGYVCCIHVINENIDIPLTAEEFEKLTQTIINDTELEIYKLRKEKGI